MSIHPDNRVLHFDAFALDLARCALRCAGEERSLRPKSFDVLRYLAEHPGRVVSKEELFGTLWPGLSVTDDSLVQCIKDVRQVLGESGRHIIKTVPKRGYLFTCSVSVSNTTVPTDLVTAPRIGLDVAEPDAQRREVPAGPAGARLTIPQRILALPPLGSVKAKPRTVILSGLTILLACGLLATTTLRGGPSAEAANHAHNAAAILAKERSPKAHREALVLFNKALALDPAHVPALLGYTRVIAVDVTEHWVPAHQRGLLLDQAEAAIQRAIQLEPRNPRVHHMNGFLWRARRDPDRAILALNEALALSPKNAWILADLARAKIDVGRAAEAIKDLETAMRLNPDEPAMHIWYYQAGMAAVHAGQAEAALEWLRKSEQASPAYLTHILPWRAVALADLGRDDEARTLVAQRLARTPSQTLAMWNEQFPRQNEEVDAQRKRIADILQRLGLPDGRYAKTGSTQ